MDKEFIAALKEIIDECIEDIIEEGKEKLKVVRKGKVKKIDKATGSNQKMVGGTAVAMGGREKAKRKLGARKAALKKKGKQHKISRKRNKSLKKRDRLGL